MSLTETCPVEEIMIYKTPDIRVPPTLRRTPGIEINLPSQIHFRRHSAGILSQRHTLWGPPNPIN